MKIKIVNPMTLEDINIFTFVWDACMTLTDEIKDLFSDMNELLQCNFIETYNGYEYRYEIIRIEDDIIYLKLLTTTKGNATNDKRETFSETSIEAPSEANSKACKEK